MSFKYNAGKAKALGKDEWRLLRYGLLAALLMTLGLWPIFVYKVHLRQIVLYAICGAIARASFWFLKTGDDETIRLGQFRKEMVETAKETEYTVQSMNAQLANSFWWYRFTWHPSGWRGAFL